jgi:hypothetical protein
LCVFANLIVLEEKEGHADIWTMYFDDVFYKTKVGLVIIFFSPTYVYMLFSYRLKFDCTNNIAKYEALGLDLDLDMKIKCLKLIRILILLSQKKKRCLLLRMRD